MTPSAPGEAIYRDDWHVRVPSGSTKVYEGEAPIDPGSGMNHYLEIWAHGSPDGFTIYVSDDGRGWVDDLSKIFRIDATEVAKLKTALRAADDDDLVELFATRIRNREVKVPGPSDHWMDIVDFPAKWLTKNGVSYSWAQRIDKG